MSAELALCGIMGGDMQVSGVCEYASTHANRYKHQDGERWNVFL